MNKEEILKKSQEENRGKLDEREKTVFGAASRIAMIVGAVICVLLVLLGELVLDSPELAFVGWMIYFAMQGSSNIVLFKHLRKRVKLVYGVVEIVFAIAFAVALVIMAVA